MRVKEKIKKKLASSSTLKRNSNNNPKIMASILITLWQIEEEKVEAVRDFIFLGSKITGWLLQP